MIDDHTRLAFTEIHRDEKAQTVSGFVERALAFFAAHGIDPKRLQTDNAWTYTHNTSRASCWPTTASSTAGSRRARRSATARWSATSRRSTASGPRTALRDSAAREAALTAWLNHYNSTRNHSSLDNRPPVTRVRNQPRHNT